MRLDLVSRLRARSTEIVEAITARIRHVAPDPTRNEDVHYATGQRAAVAAVVGYALAGIENGEDLATPIPSEAIAQAHRAARSEVGLDAVLRRYAAGYAELGDFVIQEADRSGLLRHGSVLRSVQRMQASLLDDLIAAITDEYAREVERTDRSPAQLRAKRVRRLLAGNPLDGIELGYGLDSWHLGLIGTGLGVRQAIEAITARSSTHLLCVVDDEQSVWAWLGGQRRDVARDSERLLSERWPVGVSLAVGETAKGLEGWRLTHLQAQDAALVSLYKPQTFTRYADIALLAPWLRDCPRAQGFVKVYLGPLDIRGARAGVKLRDTLRAYFGAGRNASAAADALKVSRRTVRNHIDQIEQRLGPLFNERQAELELALRLESVKGATQQRRA
jgi:PucR C-terminal helix-turn-helix domain/GGDEF-like domain